MMSLYLSILDEKFQSCKKSYFHSSYLANIVHFKDAATNLVISLILGISLSIHDN